MHYVWLKCLMRYKIGDVVYSSQHESDGWSPVKIVDTYQFGKFGEYTYCILNPNAQIANFRIKENSTSFEQLYDRPQEVYDAL